MTKHNSPTPAPKPRALKPLAHEDLTAVQGGQGFFWRSAAHDTEGSPDGSTSGA